MSTVQLKLVASSAASAQQQQPSQNNNKDKYVKVTVPVHWTVGQLRQLAALATGVCADLAEKLKLELQASSGDIGSKKKSSARKAKHAATLTTGTSVPLNEMAAQLHRFDLEAENLTVVITNWNKIGSMKKFEIVAMMHCIRSCNVGTDQQNMNAINAALVSAQDDTNFLASVVQVGQVNGSSALLKKLLKLVGFNVSDSGEVTIEAKQMTRNRRLQLFQEVVKSDTITNHADYSDCFKFPKPSLMRTFPNSADDAEEEEQKDYPPVGHLSAPTSPVVLRTEQRLFHARQHSLDEEGEDYQSDLLDDFVLSPTSRTGGNSRSRDRRRRRRERARVLLSQYQDLDYNDEADIAYASEQIRREGVPTGLDVSILRRLPVQTLTEKDMEIMMKKRECHDTHGDNFCAICLVEYHIDDAVMRLPCMHVYHRSCITKWLSANNKCPQDMIAISI